MQFANPLFLIALTALAIPVIIHLFNFRRYKKVYFTNVRFLAEIKEETKKRSKLKNLLILISRLLAVTCLVIAFAQPFLPSPLQLKKMAGKQAISIYIDNSFSMEALLTGGRLLDLAKTKAIEIAAAYKPSDMFQILTADFEGRHQRFVNREEFRARVEEIKISPVFKSLSDVIRRQNDILSGIQGANRSAFIISDFQKTSSDLQKIKPDSTIAYFFVPLKPEKINNLYIDTAWFDAPVQQAGQAVKLKVKIRNISSDLLEKIPVKLTINNVQKAMASFSVEPKGETMVTLPYTNNDGGIQYGTLEIPDYPITWDDKCFFTYPISATIPVLCINGNKPSPYLDALFGNDTAIQFRNIPSQQLDYSSFDRHPLIILNGIDDLSSGFISELIKFVKQGGSLLIFPSAKINAEGYNALFFGLNLPSISGTDTTHMHVSELNHQSVLFSDVFEKDASGRISLPPNLDMPGVTKHYILPVKTRSSWEDLLKLQNGDPLLGVSSLEKGKIYFCAVPLEESWSNFPKHTLFVPTLFKIALLSQSVPELYNIPGSDKPIRVNSDSIPASEVFRIKKLDSGFEFIPETRSSGGIILVFPHEQIHDAGLYNVVSGNKVIQGLAFNYNRMESDLNYFTSNELRSSMKQAGMKYFALFEGRKRPLTGQIKEMSQGTPLWKLFIILTLLFIAVEILLIRGIKEV